MYTETDYRNSLCHHGIKGQRWGIRRYQNPDGSLTSAGQKRYNKREQISQHYMNKAADNKKGYDNADRWIKDLKSGRKTFEDYKKTQDQDDNAYYITSKEKAIKSAQRDKSYYKDQMDAENAMAKRIMSTPLNKRTFYDKYRIKDTISKGMSVAAFAAPIVLSSIAYKKGLVSGKTVAKSILAGSAAGIIVRFNTFDTPWDEYLKENRKENKG